MATTILPSQTASVVPRLSLLSTRKHFQKDTRRIQFFLTSARNFPQPARRIILRARRIATPPATTTIFFEVLLPYEAPWRSLSTYPQSNCSISLGYAIPYASLNLWELQLLVTPIATGSLLSLEEERCGFLI